MTEVFTNAELARAFPSIFWSAERKLAWQRERLRRQREDSSGDSGRRASSRASRDDGGAVDVAAALESYTGSSGASCDTGGSSSGSSDSGSCGGE